MKSYCRKCRRESIFRRINRQGWLQRELLSRWLGFYPWECVQCRGARFFKTSGRRPERAPDNRGFVEP